MATLIFAGLATGELWWLTLDDVNYDTGADGMIRIRGKSVGGHAWKPKSGMNRAVSINSDLRTYQHKYQPETPGHGWFFPARRAGGGIAKTFRRNSAPSQRLPAIKEWACAPRAVRAPIDCGGVGTRNRTAL
jgi:hypothetical protein